MIKHSLPAPIERRLKKTHDLSRLSRKGMIINKKVSGFGFRVSGFGFRVSGFKFRVFNNQKPQTKNPKPIKI